MNHLCRPNERVHFNTSLEHEKESGTRRGEGGLYVTHVGHGGDEKGKEVYQSSPSRYEKIHSDSWGNVST